jgi:hypothetical protein
MFGTGHITSHFKLNLQNIFTKTVFCISLLSPKHSLPVRLPSTSFHANGVYPEKCHMSSIRRSNLSCLSLGSLSVSKRENNKWKEKLLNDELQTSYFSPDSITVIK